MSTQLIPFSFESASVRVIAGDDGSWSVVAKDIVEALGYPAWDRNLIKHVPEEWKGVNRIHTPGGEQEMLTLAEQGLYFFLGRSDKPKALPFQKWVFGEVVPSIRKTGSYELAPAPKPDKPRPRSVKEAFSVGLHIAKLCGFTGNQALLSADRCAVEFTGMSALAVIGATHLLADPNGRTYTPSELGKMCDPPLSGVKFNLLLESAGLQIKEFGAWIPTDAASGLFEWLDTGRRHNDGVPVKQVKWFAAVLGKINEPMTRCA